MKESREKIVADMKSLLGKAFKFKGSTLSSDDGSELSFSKGENSDPCYACTQKGIPRFHSVSCEQNHPLFLEAEAGSSLYPLPRDVPLKTNVQKTCRRWVFGIVQDPRRRRIQRLNQLFLLARAFSLALDPLFFYTLSIRKGEACVYVDGTLAILVTFLRTGFDGFHLLHMWLQLKLAYISKESLILGCGSLVWDAREIAMHYLRPGGGFLLDLFVILPIPQIILWAVVPRMISGGDVGSVMTMFLMIFLLQFIPKIAHLVFLARRMRHVTGFVFGTFWWGFALNLMAYFIAAHVAGACWYLLASERVAFCLLGQCSEIPTCKLDFLGCSPPILSQRSLEGMDSALSYNHTNYSTCFDSQNNNYGIFQWAIPLVTDRTWSTKLSYPIFWGLMTLSSFGNALQPSDHTLEVIFSIIVITCGLLLFTLLIGNIQVFLHSITAKKESMKLRIRDLEYWMRRRQLPSRLRKRVRRYERHHWAATRGVDEAGMVCSLPEGLRRDIKQHLSMDLVRQVPLFEHMDTLVLENICQRLKPHLFIKDEVVIREGDPVMRMIFIVRGHFLSTHSHNGHTSVCHLGPGNFCGDELLTWCLKKPSLERLPPSCATLTSLDSTEAFGLEAEDLKFVTDHFRYKFVNEKLKRTARYYSSGWRTWAVVTIQLAWRRYKARRSEPLDRAPSTAGNALRIAPLSRSESECNRLRFYAAMFSSHKPQDHLE